MMRLVFLSYICPVSMMVKLCFCCEYVIKKSSWIVWQRLVVQPRCCVCRAVATKVKRQSVVIKYVNGFDALLT